MSLAGMLQGIASDIGNPTQLSDGQKGLFNTLGASLAPMPAVSPDDPASLRAAAAEAMRRGDAQQARIYAVMASERENSVSQRNAYQNSMLDEGNAEIQAEAVRKRQGLTNRQMGGYFANRLTIPGLADAVKMGVIPIQEAIKQQQTYDAAVMKEQSANQRALLKESGANSRAAMRANAEGAPTAKERQADLLFPRGSQEWRDFMLGNEAPSVEAVRTRIDKRPDVDFKRINAIRDAYLTIVGSDGEAGSSQIALQGIRGLFPAGSRANAEMVAFAKAKSLPSRVKDTISMWAAGELTDATNEDYAAIAKLLHEFETSQANRGIEIEIKAGGLSDKQAQVVREASAIEELPPSFVGQTTKIFDQQNNPVYEHKGKYYYANGTEYVEAE